ncbi:LOW QUALITY PROTEIN: hypothetical protein ACHAWF_017527 [Thalassiosira exigua]
MTQQGLDKIAMPGDDAGDHCVGSMVLGTKDCSSLNSSRRLSLKPRLHGLLEWQRGGLNSDIELAATKYTDKLKDRVEQHKRVGKAHQSIPDKRVVNAKYNANDTERSMQCMQCAEKKCRHIKSGHIPFSPD